MSNVSFPRSGCLSWQGLPNAADRNVRPHHRTGSQSFIAARDLHAHECLAGADGSTTAEDDGEDEHEGRPAASWFDMWVRRG